MTIFTDPNEIDQIVGQSPSNGATPPPVPTKNTTLFNDPDDIKLIEGQDNSNISQTNAPIDPYDQKANIPPPVSLTDTLSDAANRTLAPLKSLYSAMTPAPINYDALNNWRENAPANQPIKNIADIPAGIASGFGELSSIPANFLKGLPFANRATALAEALYNSGGDTKTMDYGKSLEDVNQRWSDEIKNAPDPNELTTYRTMGSMVAPGAILSKVAQAPTMLAKALGGTTAGAGVGLMQGASDTKDLTKTSDLFGNLIKEGGMGAVFGGLVPTLAHGIGSSYNAVADKVTPTIIPGMGAASSAALRTQLQGADTPNLLANIGRLGPEATAADADPAIMNMGQGVAIKNAQAFRDFSDFYNQRAAGINSRVGQDVDTALGPLTQTQRETARALTQAGQDVREQEFNPVLNAAKGTSLNVQPVLDDVNARIINAKGPELAGLQKIRNMLEGTPAQDAVPFVKGSRLAVHKSDGTFVRNEFIPPTPGKPAVPAKAITDPEQIHNTKQAIDQMINYGAPEIGVPPGAISHAQGSISNIRGQLNNTLRGDGTAANPGVPGYGAVMDKLSDFYNQRHALNFGVNALRNPVHPTDFANDFNAMRPEEQDMVRTGMRYQANQAMLNKQNDATAISNLLQGADGGNGQNIATAFRDVNPNAQTQLNGAVSREKTFANTKQKIVDNSQTAFRDEAAKNIANNEPQYRDIIPNHGPLHDTHPFGAALGVGRGAINEAGRLFQSPPNVPAYYQNLSRAVTMQGQDAQNLYAQALRSGNNLARNQRIGKNITDALTYGGTIPPVVALENQRFQQQSGSEQ